MGWLDYGILLLLAALAAGILWRQRAARRRGTRGCGGDCDRCAGCAHHQK